MDIWDGPTEPVVYHGRTLTSKLSAREALTAIAKYAFVASPYPVILSIEVHCDHAQQDMLAETLRSSLGTALLDEPLFGEERLAAHAQCPEVNRLPSPEDLKYRILVKAKNLYVVKAALDANVADEELQMVSESSSTSSDSDLRKGEQQVRVPANADPCGNSFRRCHANHSAQVSQDDRQYHINSIAPLGSAARIRRSKRAEREPDCHASWRSANAIWSAVDQTDIQPNSKRSRKSCKAGE